jgi:hypothetical protein
LAFLERASWLFVRGGGSVGWGPWVALLLGWLLFWVAGWVSLNSGEFSYGVGGTLAGVRPFFSARLTCG